MLVQVPVNCSLLNFCYIFNTYYFSRYKLYNILHIIIIYIFFAGILSIFCAQVGAKKVYAVEASMLAIIVEQVSIANNLQDKIEVIHNKVEDIQPDSLEKIDIIVSEWMGFYLVHEGMLDSVLFARDNFLREDGLLFPAIAKLYATPCELPSMYEFWDNVCGVNMR